MKILRITLLSAVLFGAATLAWGQAPNGTAPKRPKLLGISHVGFATDDLEASRQYFRDYLGYPEMQVIKHPAPAAAGDGERASRRAAQALAVPPPAPDSVVYMTAYRVNEDQFIQLFPESLDRKNQDNKLTHISFLTDDAEGMRLYLASKGWQVPSKVTRGKEVDNINCFIRDPNGVGIEIVQYPADGFMATTRERFLAPTRLSTRIGHVGFTCDDLDKALDFYVNILGFKEIWRGGPVPEKVGWIHLRFPDSDQTIELMLSDQPPTRAKLGSQNHICLQVKDIKTVEAGLAQRTLPTGCKTTEAKLGGDRRWQLNTFSPDGTRIEFMEDHTADGTTPPSSTGVPMRQPNK